MKNIFYFLSLFLCIGITSCSSDDDGGNTNETPKSNAKAITSFKFNAVDNDGLDENITAVIDENNKTITVAVPYGTDITALLPTIEVSEGATVSPEGAQDFSSEVTYTVTAEDGTKANYTINVIESSNSDAKILSFAFLAENNTALEENVTTIIDEEAKTITAEVPYGTDITALIATVDVSPGATFTPEGIQDFSPEVTYTVTAQDGTKSDYTVTVAVTPNNEAKILSFVFLAENNTALEENITATIDEDAKTITAEVPYGTDITGLTPTLEVSPGANFTPEGPQDFSSEVTYTVTAQDGTNTVEYTVLVDLIVSQRDILIAIYNANPGNTLGWDLNDADISNWEGVVTNEDGNVIELNLGSSQLTSVPAEIELLSNLTSLALYGNQLTSLTAEIGQLSNLEYLVLFANQLTSLPSEIGQLSNLIELYLDENQLTSIPTEIGQLSNLEVLYLNHNQFTSIPAEIGQLSNLTKLFLDENQLTAIPAEIGQLSKLETLFLSDNQLTYVPAEIGQLSNLVNLNLRDNQMTAIPVEIGQLSNLVSLNLRDNQLTSLPAEIGQLTNLTDLWLNLNQLTSLPVEIGQLSNLAWLNLDENQLTSIPVEIGQLVNLYQLLLNNNNLTTIPREVCDLYTNYETEIVTDEGVTCE